MPKDGEKLLKRERVGDLTKASEHAWSRDERTNSALASVRSFLDSISEDLPIDERLFLSDYAYAVGFSELSTKNLNHALTFLFVLKGYDHRYLSSMTGISEKTYRRIMTNSAVSIKLDNLLLIIFTLDISPIISEKLIDIAGYSMHKINILYRSIMSSYRGHSIGEIDALVVRNGNPSLFTSK